MSEGKMLVKCKPCPHRRGSLGEIINHLRHDHPELELKHKDAKEVLKYVRNEVDFVPRL